MLCLYDKPTTTPKDSCGFNTQQNNTESQSLMVKKVSNVRFAWQTNTDTKSLQCWLQCLYVPRKKGKKKHWHFKSSMLNSSLWYERKVSIVEFASTNQHWHQLSSMLASMLYVAKKKRVPTFQVVRKNTDISSLQCWVQFHITIHSW